MGGCLEWRVMVEGEWLIRRREAPFGFGCWLACARKQRPQQHQSRHIGLGPSRSKEEEEERNKAIVTLPSACAYPQCVVGSQAVTS